MTDIHASIYNIINELTIALGQPPTTTEIAVKIGCTKQNISDHLNKMKKLNMVEWEYGQHRTLKIS